MLDLSWLLRRHKACPCFTYRSPSSVSAPPQAAFKALEVLFQDLPPDSGMAFVLVTHLPVGYETSLPDILGRHSAMAVTIAGNGEAIEPNHVYVCPSGSTLTVKEGRLVLSPLGAGPVPNLVDALLYSLAEDRGEQAIGVVDGEVPDHSTFSKNRHGRFRDCDLLRKLFETVVRRCMAEGLVDGVAFAVDASLIAADANKQRSAARSDHVDWETIARTRRSVREYLDTLDEAAWGAASETVPKFISRSDPAAQWTGAHKGHAFFAYADNYLIDLKAAIIVDVEATRAIRQAEVGAARTMIERTEDRLGLCPERLAADSAYGSAEMLGWLVNERAIEPHIPVFDKSARDDGTFSREDFAYNQKADVYVCPADKVLTSTGTLVNDGATLLYRASKYDCDACELKPRCCPKMPARKVPRSIHEQARDVARDVAKTDAYVKSRRERKKIEMLFAHLKRILRLDRLRLRGPFGARDEFLLAATAQNFRKLAKLILPPTLKPA